MQQSLNVFDTKICFVESSVTMAIKKDVELVCPRLFTGAEAARCGPPDSGYGGTGAGSPPFVRGGMDMPGAGLPNHHQSSAWVRPDSDALCRSSSRRRRGRRGMAARRAKRCETEQPDTS